MLTVNAAELNYNAYAMAFPKRSNYLALLHKKAYTMCVRRSLKTTIETPKQKPNDF